MIASNMSGTDAVIIFGLLALAFAALGCACAVEGPAVFMFGAVMVLAFGGFAWACLARLEQHDGGSYCVAWDRYPGQPEWDRCLVWVAR